MATRGKVKPRDDKRTFAERLGYTGGHDSFLACYRRIRMNRPLDSFTNEERQNIEGLVQIHCRWLDEHRPDAYVIWPEWGVSIALGTHTVIFLLGLPGLTKLSPTQASPGQRRVSDCFQQKWPLEVMQDFVAALNIARAEGFPPKPEPSSPA